MKLLLSRSQQQQGFLLVEFTIALFLWTVFVVGIMHISSDVIGIGRSIEQRITLIERICDTVEGGRRAPLECIKRQHYRPGVYDIPVYAIDAEHHNQTIHSLAWCYE